MQMTSHKARKCRLHTPSGKHARSRSGPAVRDGEGKAIPVCGFPCGLDSMWELVRAFAVGCARSGGAVRREVNEVIG